MVSAPEDRILVLPMTLWNFAKGVMVLPFESFFFSSRGFFDIFDIKIGMDPVEVKAVEVPVKIAT